MTDKQIIIDSADVSGCEYIREVGLDSEYICTCNSPNKTSDYCKHNPNCYYKQLKRAEAQCEDMFVKHTDLEMKYKRKEQECEELKEWKKEHLKDVEFIERNPVIDILNSMADNILLKQQLDQLKAELQKYKDMEAKGLEEFKDIGGCWGCGIQSSLDEVVKEFQQYKASKQASYEEMQKRCNELELKNRELNKCYKNNSALLDFEETNTTKLVNKIMKLEQTLAEIKEILLKTPTDSQEHCVNTKSVILQKIREVLDEEV